MSGRAYTPHLERANAAEVEVSRLKAVVQQQADRIAWLEGDVAGWRIKNQQLRDALAVAVDVAIWMSGSGSFGPGGEAVAGWQKQRVRLYEVMDVLDGTPSAAQTLEDGTPTERAEASSNG